MRNIRQINNIVFSILLVLTATKVNAQQPNIALHKPVYVTSEDPANPAGNMVDGVISRKSKWAASLSKAPHIVEIDLKKYYTLTEIRVHSGIMDSEKKPDEMTQAAGFWSVKNFKLQYWDDANWSDFPKAEVHENRLTTVDFKFNPGISTYKIRLVCDDGEPISIMEIEAFGDEMSNMPAPPSVNADIPVTKKITSPQDAVITVNNKIIGKSLKFVGYNQGYYFPGSNVSGWIEYSGVNALRVWTSLNSFVPESAVEVNPAIKTVSEFDKRKAGLRANPEHNSYIKWNDLYPLYDKLDSSSTNAMEFNYALDELKRLGIQVVLQINNTDFKDDWENKWKQWQRFYALAYYTAKRGNVAMFAMHNEPNHRNAGPMKLETWIMGMQIVSDAIHAAVNDVNKQYNKKLEPKFVGPVTAGQNTDWWAAISKAIRTDYHGKTIDHDLIDIFSTHSYNSPAAGYESRVSNIRKIIMDNHPAHQSLPIVYTEIGRWMNAYLIDKEETMDSPSLFTEWAGIYANNMKNGCYGMWAFKLANTSSSTYPLGIKSGHHYIWQGKRIVEDAYTNLALDKTVTAGSETASAKLVTDGDKSDASTWISDTTAQGKWLEINLGETRNLGSAVVYTGSSYGVYTSPDRVKNFSLQYFSNGSWKDIPGAVQKNCKYAQVFMTFKTPVSTSRIRFKSTDKGQIKVREIKVFDKNDGPSDTPDYNISGIQRTGEVVRLFAKGFKNERPLLQTSASVKDNDLDSWTSFDKASGSYYMWLVQRGTFDYRLTIDISQLDVAAGSTAIAETVNKDYYGEASHVLTVSGDKKLSLTLPSQSVMLLTIPAGKKTAHSVVYASADASVAGGEHSSENYGANKQLEVQLDASKPANNKVSYISFDLSKTNVTSARRILFRVKGYADKDNRPYRLHVYAVPSVAWQQNQLNWTNAPLLDKKEALIHEVGTKAAIAGELAFTTTPQYHNLDVTNLLKKHVGKAVTFILVRETRQLGDDEDKGRKVLISSSESADKPKLEIW
ncbi:discoidin domain-containing protein [Pedobacter sp. BS3]|uniref:discoidin domain-containing protein n=1 Tax=Pedobacter sp. BS3 TaxID=2567937 RepID=UPI0011EDB8CC|nr:discoidin domain-containing protein [Pedobacter sp. BS3]TZF81005.1 discoidin domain-containing protein [Pedobacter sp. BS3]